MNVKEQLAYINGLNPAKFEPKQADVIEEIQGIAKSFPNDVLFKDPEMVGMIEQAYSKLSKVKSPAPKAKSAKPKAAAKPKVVKSKIAKPKAAPKVAVKKVATKKVAKPKVSKKTVKVGDLNRKQEQSLKKALNTTEKKLKIVNEILKQDTKKLEAINRISSAKSASTTGAVYKAKKKGKKLTDQQKTKALAQRVRSQAANNKRRKKSTNTAKRPTQYVSLLEKIFTPKK